MYVHQAVTNNYISVGIKLIVHTSQSSPSNRQAVMLKTSVKGENTCARVMQDSQRDFRASLSGFVFIFVQQDAKC